MAPKPKLNKKKDVVSIDLSPISNGMHALDLAVRRLTVIH